MGSFYGLESSLSIDVPPQISAGIRPAFAAVKGLFGERPGILGADPGGECKIVWQGPEGH